MSQSHVPEIIDNYKYKIILALIGLNLISWLI